MFKYHKISLLGPGAVGERQTAYCVNWCQTSKSEQRPIGIVYKTDEGFNIDQFATTGPPEAHYKTLIEASWVLFWKK